MATVATTNGHHSVLPAGKVELSPSTSGLIHAPQITPESAKSISDLLQDNHDKYHIFFNARGMHNHIVHHLLTIYALGATPNQLQKGFDDNKSYQRTYRPAKDRILEQMSSSRTGLANHFGNGDYFPDFEKFFATEIDRMGVKGTLQEWVFKGDDVAEGLLTRLFAGLNHPIIHFGFALEFHQPALLTEALAQAAVHKDRLAEFLIGAEKAASARKDSSRKSLITLIDEARANPTIKNSPHLDDDNKISDGIMTRAAQPMIDLASQWTVQPMLEDLKFKTAEMIQATFYYSAGAQHPRKIPKFDFYYIHCTNSSIFFSAFLEDEKVREVFGDGEVGTKNLARMLEMKGRGDLLVYVSRNSPELDMERIKTYAPKHPEQAWPQLFQRACELSDDGHSSKLLRAAANGERVCQPYEDRENWPIRGDMWLKVGHMIMDSVEADGPTWVRDAGWESSWDVIPDRKDSKL